MLWKDRNGKMHSTLSCHELVELSATDEFIENCKLVAEKTGNLNLFEEMFGTEENN
jgi:hypothetical protein|tara:strand:- start:231 stop:398 length:168 start_codon:yes stop_codon:yes gene_type:complete